jgi:hypothetical protein
MDLMSYKGRYTVKNKSKYKGDSSSVVYRSMWEKWCFKWCDENSSIKSWSSEEVVIPYLYDVDKKYHRYFMDLKITYNNNKTVLIEIKPEKQTLPPVYPGRKTKAYLNEGLTYVKNMNKWTAADAFAKDRGWTFQIWTEKHLEKMGIKPKPLKPLKKIKPLGPVKKKKKR